MPTLELVLPRPHAGQRAIIETAQRFNVLAAGRRWGKNTLAEDRLVHPVLHGDPVAWFSPTYKTLAEDWRRLCHILRPVIYDKSEQEHRLLLTTRGVVDMWSLEEPDSARGRAYKRIVIDEAASVRRLLYAWQQVIRPMLTDYEGDAWFISTPKGFDDFYTLWQWGQDSNHPEWRSWRRPTSENPHIPPDDLAQAERDLPSVVYRQEYLAEFLAGGIGQFFSEWDPAIHLCPMPEMPKSWRRFGALDYGFVGPFCYLQMALSPDGMGYVYRELYKERVADSDQARLIAQTCGEDVPEYVVAGPDLWHKSGKGVWGQSTAETYAKVWAEQKFGAHLTRAADDRIMGWRRVREWLKPFVGPNDEQTARLQIVEGTCPNLVRTLPQLVHDEAKPEDVNTDSEDHAPDALRYGLMSRPAPKLPPKPNPPSDFTAEAAFKLLEERRKRKKYIGGEFLR
jgi:hypothetical protein